MKRMNLFAWCFGQRKAEHIDRRPECFASDAEAIGGALSGTEMQETAKQKKEISLTQLMTLAVLLIGLIFDMGIPKFALAESTHNYSSLLNNDDRSIPAPILRLIEQTTPLPAEPGIVDKLGQFPDTLKATIAFCATALQQSGDQYATFVRIMHEELVTYHDLESGSVRGRHPYFLTQFDQRALFLRCLEHDATNASPETLNRLFQIEESNGRSPNTYFWLVRSAEGGNIQAQYTLAKSVWEWSWKPLEAPTAIHPYINPGSYYRFIRSVADGGNRAAQMDLASFYLGLFPAASWKNNNYVNTNKGIRWLEKLSDQTEDAYKRYQAISFIGSLYLNGTNVPDDYIGFLPWYQRREKEMLPSFGSGVPKDYSQALQWYLKIPENELGKHCGAAIGLAKIYRAGLGVGVNLEKAENYQQIVLRYCVKV